MAEMPPPRLNEPEEPDTRARDRRTKNVIGGALALLVAGYFVGERTVGAERGSAYMIGYGVGQVLVYAVPLALIGALVWWLVRSRRTGD